MTELVRVQRRTLCVWNMGRPVAWAAQAQPEKPQDCAGPVFDSATVWSEGEQLEVPAQTCQRRPFGLSKSPKFSHNLE